MMYLYGIYISGILRYIGITKNVIRRYSQHLYACNKKLLETKLSIALNECFRAGEIPILKILHTFKSEGPARLHESQMVAKFSSSVLNTVYAYERKYNSVVTVYKGKPISKLNFKQLMLQTIELIEFKK